MNVLFMYEEFVLSWSSFKSSYNLLELFVFQTPIIRLEKSRIKMHYFYNSIYIHTCT